MKKLSSFIFLASLIFVGCAYKIYKDPSGAIQNFDLPKEQKVRLSFNFIYQNVFVSNCVSCHGNAGSVNLETYSNVLAHLSKIKIAVFDDHTMPRKGTLTSQELAILWTWIEMGAPEKPQRGTPDPTPEPVQPSFESINKNIFQVTCVKCHSADNSGKRVLLTKEELLNSPRELVLPGNVDESGLVIALERKDEKRMPPAKEGYSQLKDDQIKAIREWIAQGAAN